MHPSDHSVEGSTAGEAAWTLPEERVAGREKSLVGVSQMKGGESSSRSSGSTYTTDGERGAECSRTQPCAILCKNTTEASILRYHRRCGERSKYYGGTTW